MSVFLSAKDSKITILDDKIKTIAKKHTVRGGGAIEAHIIFQWLPLVCKYKCIKQFIVKLYQNFALILREKIKYISF